MNKSANYLAVEIWKKAAKKVFLLTMLSFGIIMTIAFICIDFINSHKTPDYVSVEATLIDAQRLGDVGGTSAYSLVYEYEVDGVVKTYAYITDYEMAAGAVPKIGSKKIIEYNPDHPGQVYNSDNKFGIFQIVGVMLIFIPLTMLLASLERHKASTISLCIGMFSIVALLTMKFNLHQAGFMGIIAIAIPSIIGIAGIMELITGRHGVDKKI